MYVYSNIVVYSRVVAEHGQEYNFPKSGWSALQKFVNGAPSQVVLSASIKRGNPKRKITLVQHEHYEGEANHSRRCGGKVEEEPSQQIGRAPNPQFGVPMA